MTQITPNSSSQNTNNTRGSSSKTIQVEGQTSVPHYSPSELLPYPKTAIKLRKSKPEEIEENTSTKGSHLQWRSARWWQGQTLRNKATALAIALGTLPVLAIGATSYYFADQSIRTEIFHAKETLALNTANTVNQFMRERYADVTTLANLPILADSRVRAVMPDAEKEEVLNKYLESLGVYDIISVSDLQGKVILQSKGETQANLFEREYFQQTLKTDRPYLSQPEKSEATGKSSLYALAPVKDSSTGKTIAIIRLRLPVENMEKVLKLPKKGIDNYHLIDASGTYFSASETEHVGQIVKTDLPGYSELHAAHKLQSRVVFDEHTHDEQVIAFTPFQPLEGLPDLQWETMIATDAADAFAPQRQLLLTTVVGTGIAALFVGALSAFIADRAIRPVVSAAKAVDKIGQGDLDTRLEVQGEDEIAVLSSNINDMANQLEIFVAEQALAADQARLLAKVTGSRALSSQDLYDLFERTLEEVRKILKVDRLLLYRFNPDGNPEIAAESVARGWQSALNHKIQDLFIPDQQLEAYKEGHVISLNNIWEAQTDLHPDQLRFMERLEVKANLEVVILHEGESFGVLMAQHCSAPHDWQQSEIIFFKQLATQMGLSLDRVILLEQTEQLAQEQRQLKEDLQKRALELLIEVDPISKGDLTIRAKVTADEIGTIADSYNATVANLRKIVLQVQEAASQVVQTTSTNEISVQALSAEALHQAEEIAVALERAQEMAQSVRLIAASAEKAEEAVKQSVQTVQEGDAAMNRTVDGILAIRETVAETAKKVKHLGESSQKISTVVNLISTFAAQTNLLALNASIEAARAGEEGRGFAVVADEVRSLARQSAEATSEIEKLVASIQAETNEVVAAMEAGTQQVVSGTQLVDETRQSLNKITAASTQINQLVEAIAQATVVQFQASEEVTKSMTNVAQIAQKTSKEASTVSSSFEQLLTVAQALQEDVRRFKLS